MIPEVVEAHGLKFRLLYSEAEVMAQIDKIGQNMNARFGAIREQDPTAKILLVGILNGGFMFFSELLKRIEQPVLVEFIKCKSYVGEESQELKLASDFKWELVTDAHLVIVDDICDTGSTLASLGKLFQGRGAKSFETAVLVKRPDREHQLAPTYCGLTCSAFIVGFGLDFNQFGRQYPRIYQKIDE